jgi:hypothetical protein
MSQTQGLTKTANLFHIAMMKQNLVFLACVLTAVILAGCVSTVDNRHVFGIPGPKDKIIGRYERPPADIWTAAQDVIKHNGVLTSVDTLQAVLEGSIDQRTVWVKVEQDDPKYTKVTVQVRTSGGGADVDLASEIDKQIAIRLATGNLTPATKPNTR